MGSITTLTSNAVHCSDGEGSVQSYFGGVGPSFTRSNSAPNFGRLDARGYLEAEKLMDWLNIAPVQDFDLSGHPRLTVASMNFLDPTVARLSGNPFVQDTVARYSGIAREFAQSQVQLVACQEANAQSSQALVEEGYQVIGLDINEGIKPSWSRMKSPPQSKPYTPLGRIKRSWTGVQLCFNPNLYTIKDGHEPAFLAFPSEYQKNWQHAAYAVGALLFQVLKCPFGRSQFGAASLHLFESLSGPMRTDGLLVTHLEEKLTREDIVFCATHIESFDRTIAHGQLDVLCAHVSRLRQEYPEKTFVIAADFNWQVGAGDSATALAYESIVGLFNRRLNAITMPIEHIQPTLVGKQKAIDGVFFIPPEGTPSGHVRGISLWPGAENQPNLELSDHHSVVAQLLY